MLRLEARWSAARLNERKRKNKNGGPFTPKCMPIRVQHSSLHMWLSFVTGPCLCCPSLCCYPRAAAYFGALDLQTLYFLEELQHDVYAQCSSGVATTTWLGCSVTPPR